ncbi:M20/M25/M40 family metallo-hydrolase [Croceibacterium salegens]|nr:M20/M25/M40 family metallo-hydrolase [Croceibacterium salegens]
MPLVLLSAPLHAEDDSAVAAVIDEGLNRNEALLRAQDLMDRIGPRLTNSPGMRKAEEWAVKEMAEIGLSNIHKEGFEFGRGWEQVRSDVWMLSPRPIELTAIPLAWTPGTDGRIEGEVVVAPMSKKEHFEAYRGKLAGKIVLVSKPGTGDEPSTAPFNRLETSDIAKRDTMALPTYDPHAIAEREAKGTLVRGDFTLALDEFLRSEGAIAWAKISYRDGKLLHGSNYTYLSGRTPQLPAFEIAAEDYRRLARLSRVGPAPRVSLDSEVRFTDDDTKGYNIIGEIPGSDPKAGYIMVGGHFDSWAAGDGAVDNGASTVAILEAARILKATGAKPKRTIRFVLWSGEEQGLLGSFAYIRQHIASRAGEENAIPGAEPSFWADSWPITPKPGYSELKAYFNMDNGVGKIRGIHAEGNVAAESLLGKWLKPFASLGAEKVVSGSTSGTDHVFFQRLGLPAFQFIQDPLDYSARLHHTNIDTFDHIPADDLRQTSTVIAGILLQAANDSATLPREPLPKKPVETKPFEWKYPDED